MGYGKALLAGGILLSIVGYWAKADWLGAIGVLMIVASPFIGLIMTALDPLLQGRKEKKQATQIEYLKKVPFHESSIERNTKFCSNCGAETDRTAVFCNRCGAQQEPVQPKQDKSESATEPFQK